MIQDLPLHRVTMVCSFKELSPRGFATIPTAIMTRGCTTVFFLETNVDTFVGCALRCAGRSVSRLVQALFLVIWMYTMVLKSIQHFSFVYNTSARNRSLSFD